jgi:hypothetical protein
MVKVKGEWLTPKKQLKLSRRSRVDPPPYGVVEPSWRMLEATLSKKNFCVGSSVFQIAQAKATSAE